VESNTQLVTERAKGSQSLGESLQHDPLAHAASHLRVALSQSIPSDDQVILDHVREALRILELEVSRG
jgi:hypothetical protein